jgi:hypothetical protein
LSFPRKIYFDQKNVNLNDRNEKKIELYFFNEMRR